MFGLNGKKATSLKLAVTATATMFALAACGGSSGDSSASTTAGGGGSQSGESVVGTSDVSGKTVLVDKSGQTLYFADQDKAGAIKCIDSCVGFWFPLTVKGKAMPTGSGVSADKLSTVKRPDTGSMQVTYAGHPLYTFKLDSKDGSTKGDGFTDDFDGTTFEWHAATTSGASSPSPSGSSSSGGDGGKYDY